MVRAVALSARVRAQRLSETHLERKQVGIVGRRCQRADALCELVEVVLVLARGADGEPDVRCEGVEVFRTDEGRVVGSAYVALRGAGKMSR
jgi:hypothetical protein